jgi:hypothetical protein|tara:strand:- start:981 stop:1559 length:579 start_codon:yes stop_codon:yes gene_type:complete
MIEYYKKLNIKMPNINIIKGKVYDSYGVEENGKFIGVEYGKFFIQDRKSKQSFDNLLNIIPENKKKYFNQSYMFANHTVYPHIDDNINSSINIYVKVNGGRTTFHKKKSDDVKDIKNVIGRFGGEYNKDSKSEFIDFTDVEDICSFVAEIGDVYIVNTNILHSVTKDKDNRILICIHSSLSIDEVIKIFKGV